MPDQHIWHLTYVVLFVPLAISLEWLFFVTVDQSTVYQMSYQKPAKTMCGENKIIRLYEISYLLKLYLLEFSLRYYYKNLVFLAKKNWHLLFLSLNLSYSISNSTLQPALNFWKISTTNSRTRRKEINPYIGSRLCVKSWKKIPWQKIAILKTLYSFSWGH